MRRYEMVLVADPTIPEAEHDRLLTTFEEFVGAQGGAVHKVDRWGRRKLAYPIKKHTEGNYTVLLFDGSVELEKEMLRRIKLSDQWLRHLSVRADEQALPTDEEKQALVEARSEYLRRAAEREAAIAAGVDLSTLGAEKDKTEATDGDPEAAAVASAAEPEDTPETATAAEDAPPAESATEDAARESAEPAPPTEDAPVPEQAPRETGAGETEEEK